MMNLPKLISCIHPLGTSNKFQHIRLITTFPVRYLNQKWRKDKGLPMNPNAYGPLTDKPDYTFLDGRPTPYGVRQRNRFVKQREIAEKIITFVKEIDFAVERHERLVLEEQQNKRAILDSKLKPKGVLLLKRK